MGNEARLRVFARRRVVQAVDVGQEDEKTGLYETGDNGGQCVVVAEFDFFGGDGVVFVDNGNGAESEQALKGVHGVLFALGLLGEAEFAGADTDSASFPAPLKFNRKLFFPLVNQYRNSHGSYKNEHAGSQNRNKAETAYRLRQTANLRAAHRLQYHA